MLTRHPRIKKTGICLCGLAGLLLIAALLLVLFFPVERLREIVNERGSGATHREFAIDGPLKIHWSWREPRIYAEKIRLANSNGAEDPYMVEIKTVEFSIRPWNLLRGKLVLPSVKIDKPTIILEKDGDDANWRFDTVSSANMVTEAALPGNRREFPVIGRLVVTDGRLIYRDKQKDMHVDLQLDTATGDGNRDGDVPIRVKGTGTLQGREFNLEASGGSLDLMRDPSVEFPLDLKLNMGATEIAVSGRFRDPVKMQGVDAQLKLSGNNMADLFYLTGIPLPPTPDYSLSGKLRKEDKVWNFNDFKGKVGDSDLHGDVRYDTGGERGFLTADLRSSLMDIKDLGGFIGKKPDQPDAPRDRVFPDVPLNLSRLRAADMDVTLKAEKIVAPNLPFRTMDTRLKLDNGMLTIDPLRFNMESGAFDGRLVLNGQGDIPAVDLKAELKELSLAQFFKDTRFKEQTSGKFGGYVELAGYGESFADVLGVSQGRMIVTMKEGTMSLLIVEAADLDVSEATPLFLGEDTKTEIRCMVGDFIVNDGLARSQILLIDTADSNINGEVGIDLKSEDMEAKINADSKNPSPAALQAPITISGKLKKPSIGIEPVEAGLRAGAAAVLGTLLTPVAAAIPYLEVGLAKDNDCGRLLGIADKETSKARNN